MRYKFSFSQEVEGVEYCDAVVVADSKEEALDRLKARDFTMYIVQKNDLERGKMFDVEDLGEVN